MKQAYNVQKTTEAAALPSALGPGPPPRPPPPRRTRLCLGLLLGVSVLVTAGLMATLAVLLWSHGGPLALQRSATSELLNSTHANAANRLSATTATPSEKVARTSPGGGAPGSGPPASLQTASAPTRGTTAPQTTLTIHHEVVYFEPPPAPAQMPHATTTASPTPAPPAPSTAAPTPGEQVQTVLQHVVPVFHRSGETPRKTAPGLRMFLPIPSFKFSEEHTEPTKRRGTEDGDGSAPAAGTIEAPPTATPSPSPTQTATTEGPQRHSLEAPPTSTPTSTQPTIFWRRFHLPSLRYKRSRGETRSTVSGGTDVTGPGWSSSVRGRIRYGPGGWSDETARPSSWSFPSLERAPFPPSRQRTVGFSFRPGGGFGAGGRFRDSYIAARKRMQETRARMEALRNQFQDRNRAFNVFNGW